MDSNEMKRLVNDAKKSDAHAFALLYELVYEDLYRMAYYTLGNEWDAKDVVSDTVIDAYEGISKLKDETAFRAWIFKILSNKCKRKIKNYIDSRENIESYDSEGSQEIPANDNLENKVLNQEVVKKAFEQINAEERLIVTMVVYGGYNSTEIGKILFMNKNTVRSKYNRALDKMKEYLSKGDIRYEHFEI